MGFTQLFKQGATPIAGKHICRLSLGHLVTEDTPTGLALSGGLHLWVVGEEFGTRKDISSCLSIISLVLQLVLFLKPLINRVLTEPLDVEIPNVCCREAQQDFLLRKLP